MIHSNDNFPKVSVFFQKIYTWVIFVTSSNEQQKLKTSKQYIRILWFLDKPQFTTLKQTNQKARLYKYHLQNHPVQMFRFITKQTNIC